MVVLKQEQEQDYDTTTTTNNINAKITNKNTNNNAKRARVDEEVSQVWLCSFPKRSFFFVPFRVLTQNPKLERCLHFSPQRRQTKRPFRAHVIPPLRILNDSIAHLPLLLHRPRRRPERRGPRIRRRSQTRVRFTEKRAPSRERIERETVLDRSQCRGDDEDAVRLIIPLFLVSR